MHWPPLSPDNVPGTHNLIIVGECYHKQQGCGSHSRVAVRSASDHYKLFLKINASCVKKKKSVKESVMFCETTKQNIICLLWVPAHIIWILLYLKAAHSGAVGWGTGCDSQWCHWNVLLMWSFPPHYDPGVDSASNRNEYQGHCLGIKVASA